VLLNVAASGHAASRLHQLLDPCKHQFISAYAGAIIAITVLRRGIGRTAWQRARGLSRPQALDGSDHLAIRCSPA